MRRQRFGLVSLAILLGVLACGIASGQPAPGTPQPERKKLFKPKVLRADGKGFAEVIRVVRDLEYVAGGHERNKLDLYLIAHDERPRPVIVWIHGGAWRAGSKDGCPASPFVEQGYAVASINYRLSQHAKFPAQIEDCKAAIRWLRAHAKEYHLDPDHIGVWGASAGGHLVALLGASGGVKDLEGKGGNLDQSSRVQCVVDFFGPTDFREFLGREKDPNTPEAQLLGGPVQENKEKAARANPITYVSRDDPPFLIVHGEEDRTVPIGQSELLYEALKKAGVERTMIRVPGMGHGGRGFQTKVEKQVTEFFEKHLKPRTKTGTGPNLEK